MRFKELYESTVQIDHDRYDETENLNDILQSKRWQSAVSTELKNLFHQMYPGIRPDIEKDYEGVRISTGDGSYYQNDNNEFIATITGPEAYIGIDGTIYVGLGFSDIVSGKYKGIVSKLLQHIVPKFAKSVKGTPAIIIGIEDQSNGIWQSLANKLAWPYIDETQS